MSEISSIPNPPEIMPLEPIQTTTGDSSSLGNSTPIVSTQDLKNPNPPSYLKAKKLGLFKSKPKVSKPKPVDTTTTNNSNSHGEIDALHALSNLIELGLKDIEEASEKLVKYKDNVTEQTREARDKFKMIKDGGNRKELVKLQKTVTKLRLQISSRYRIRSEEDDLRRNQRSNDFAKSKRIIADDLLIKMPQLYKNPTFENSSEFQDFQTRYNDLSTELKLCLLCFSIFPENAIIKKRLMIYWWIGERFVPPSVNAIANGKTAEEFANEFFRTLMEKGFIEPVYKKRSLVVGSCKMHPFFHSAVSILAERAKFFDFDTKGTPTENYSISSYRASLMGEGLTNFQDLEKLHMLFNVNEGNLDFKPEWFLKMRNINLLYLGRWQISSTHHIEVEVTNFLEGMENMKHLRLFSLQGVSRITELPESISQLTSLTILDLRACHNLEVIPKGIGLLKCLTHLDMSECYLLDHMPKELSLLSELQVFKGFVVVDLQGKNSCTLDDLAKLQKLRKLSIYSGVKEFPSETHLCALQRFQVLQKLTVAWGGGASHAKSDNPSKPVSKKKPESQGPQEFSKLEKLDIQCFPGNITPYWLTPAYLKGLKKLYIRGGKFTDLGQYQDIEDIVEDERPPKYNWAVEVLRLKYLSKLEMGWREMQELFPDLIYLEKVNCPMLTFFPCDESGVWMNKTKLK